LARNFPIDKDGAVDSTTQALLASPIKHVQGLLGDPGKDDANAGARTLCNQLKPLMAKYPFLPSSTMEATLPEVSAIFRPNDGALWMLYQNELSKFAVLQGSELIAKPGSGTITPQFLAFFNRAAAVSTALFPSGAQQPQFAFSVRVNPTEDVQNVNLSIGGKALQYGGGAGTAQSFVWQGIPQDVKLRVKFTGGSEFDFPGSTGLWAIFRFFAHFEHWQTSGSATTMDWTLRAGTDPVVVPKSGRPATVSLVVDTGAAPNILRPGYFSSLVCPAPAVR
jgi:type VI secretion system protein ImpL